MFSPGHDLVRRNTFGNKSPLTQERDPISGLSVLALCPGLGHRMLFSYCSRARCTLSERHAVEDGVSVNEEKIHPCPLQANDHETLYCRQVNQFNCPRPDAVRTRQRLVLQRPLC